MGSATWVRSGEKKSDEEVIDLLLTLINVQNKTKQEIIPIHESHFITKPRLRTSEVQTDLPVDEELPTSPVDQWLHLPSATLQLSSGRTLIVYMNLLAHKDAQYDEHEHPMRAHGVSREKFTNLIPSFPSVGQTKLTTSTAL